MENRNKAMFENNGMNRAQWMKKISVIVLGSVIAAYGFSRVIYSIEM